MEIKGITKSFGVKKILKNVSIDIPDGSVSVIYGTSGRGKTTLLRIIMGLENPDGGEISGVPKRISAVFQEDRLPLELSPVACIKMTSNAAKSEILTHLAEAGLSGHENRPVRELSGGMKRRVAIVRAVIHPSELIVMDEPFTGMDADTKKLVADYIMRHRCGRTVIAVSHSPEDAELLGGKAIMLVP